ncbi:unnamed protein product [Chondrus crispus]|uniref:Uncharacterized protein n=1 Tax=Chondrus crispus TaxID=2769 RepID=R7QCM8_CHOCR|nr:unnamed protein product [Chondrus crispus]CDF35215.1 unnamed protein product [Chondrus crispus]|eukprot:XP_005715034.1 unnamed protein product [Chondrus crispus]
MLCERRLSASVFDGAFLDRLLEVATSKEKRGASLRKDDDVWQGVRRHCGQSEECELTCCCPQRRDGRYLPDRLGVFSLGRLAWPVKGHCGKFREDVIEGMRPSSVAGRKEGKAGCGMIMGLRSCQSCSLEYTLKFGTVRSASNVPCVPKPSINFDSDFRTLSKVL